MLKNAKVLGRIGLPCCTIPNQVVQNKKFFTLPKNEEELLRPSYKEVSMIAEVSEGAVKAFKALSKHFPKAWGFMWELEENSLSRTIMNMPRSVRESIYRQLASKECSQLRNRVSIEEQSGVIDGLLAVGGENGKKVISEAYQCVGLPALITYRCDLALVDVKNRVPLSWIACKAPAAFNIHPAPPEKPGAGVYVPSLLAGEKEYGVTVHFLTREVDKGAVIAVRRFPIPNESTTTSLRLLTTDHCFEMFEDLFLRLKFTEPLTRMSTSCHYTWRGHEITRKMKRRMLEEAKRKFGPAGHPALL